MISKVGAVIVVVIMVSLCYLIMLVVIPFLSDITLSVNSTLASSHNMSGEYPGTSGMLLSIPWLLFFTPAVIGIGLIVVILRGEIWHQQ